MNSPQQISGGAGTLNPAGPRTEAGVTRSWQATAFVAGVFLAVLAVAMLASHFTAPVLDPLKSPELRQLKEKLRLNPADEPTKQQLRKMDLALRQRYFRQLSRMNLGVYMLLGGAAFFVLACTRVAHHRKRPPMPRPNPDAAGQLAQAARVSRWAVASAGSAVAIGFLVLSLSSRSPLPPSASNMDNLLGPEAAAALLADASTPAELKQAAGRQRPNDAAAGRATDAVSPEEFLQNWPRFRGPGGNGVSALTNLPAAWDAKTGEAIAWKIPVPASGFNSPIAWGDRLFLSGGDAARREVFCFDIKTGQLVWRQAVPNVPGSPGQPAEIPDSTGYAASSMATDGRRVYVIFATGDVAALTFDGKLVWAKGFGPLKNPYGHATSLATWQNCLLLQLDQGDNEEGRSRLYALDGRTGQTVWQTTRKVGSSWATPIVIEAAGKAQVITLAVPWVISYAVTNGAELWRLDGLNGEITPSPVFNGRLVFVPSPADKLLAIRPDGVGDVTKTHVAWTNEDNVPDVTSPVSNGELLFTVTTSGLLTCFDAQNGKKQWEHDYEMECHASPGIAGQRLYVFGQKGVAVVVEPQRQFKELFRTEMPDAFHASPVFAQDRMILRGVTNLWCIGNPVSGPKAGAGK